jgi:hypothetical protein
MFLELPRRAAAPNDPDAAGSRPACTAARPRTAGRPRARGPRPAVAGPRRRAPPPRAAALIGREPPRPAGRRETLSPAPERMIFLLAALPSCLHRPRPAGPPRRGPQRCTPTTTARLDACMHGADARGARGAGAVAADRPTDGAAPRATALRGRGPSNTTHRPRLAGRHESCTVRHATNGRLLAGAGPAPARCMRAPPRRADPRTHYWAARGRPQGCSLAFPARRPTRWCCTAAASAPGTRPPPERLSGRSARARRRARMRHALRRGGCMRACARSARL